MQCQAKLFEASGNMMAFHRVHKLLGPETAGLGKGTTPNPNFITSCPAARGLGSIPTLPSQQVPFLPLPKEHCQLLVVLCTLSILTTPWGQQSRIGSVLETFLNLAI